MTTGVVLADDHPIFLDGLKLLIDAEPDLAVVASVDCGEAAVEAVREKAPGLLVTDIAMGGIGGIEAARQARAISGQLKILILSMHAEKRYVLAGLQAGANGYLLKDCAHDELVKALRSLMNDHTYLSPAVATHVVNAYAASDTPVSRLEALTPREREVLCLIAAGKKTRDIADAIGISPKTVATHREHLMEKLSVTSVAELALYALRAGLVCDD